MVQEQDVLEGEGMRILLADDQAKVRSALRLILDQEPGIEVVGEAVDLTGVLDWIQVTRFDLMLLDWELPGLENDQDLEEIYDQCPWVEIIALSGRPEARQAALDAGTAAFVSKGDPPNRLLAAIREVSGIKAAHAAREKSAPTH
jgi:DNA-binding NarL/FixJ family response regulator